uniref:Activin_recp domain-containing protein n=1 Tax=Rhabditophanes sp. KR3021 TaxID=114890 RepID=A0AC35TT67_9BILA
MHYCVFICLFAIATYQLSYALQCDQYMDLNADTQHVSSKKPYAITQKCKACGFFESNNYEGKFSGLYIGCFETAIDYALTFGSTKVNFTEAKDQCESNLKNNTPYCYKHISTSEWNSTMTSTVCCCNTDYCSRIYATPHTDNFQEIAN